MALALTSTRGGCVRVAHQSSTACVVFTRLSMSSWRRARVHGGPMTGAPARFTMASMRALGGNVRRAS